METEKNKKIKVSVIIPVWNQEELIIKCLDSIPNREDIEVVVVNDGSTDRTEESVLNYKRLNVVYIKQENSGQGVARDKGVEIANGEFVYFLDSDDYLFTDNWLSVVDNYLNDTNNVIKGYCEFNSLKHGGPGDVLNNSFLRRSMANKIKHTYMKKAGEDSEYAMKFRKEFGNNELTLDVVFYHYNYPREGSASWNAKHH